MNTKLILTQVNYFLLLIATSAFFLSCKKIDTDQNQELNIKQKFFKLPENASPILKRVIQNLKEQDARHPFVENFVKYEGYPLWNHAKITFHQDVANKDEETADTLLLIPVILNNALYVKDILAVKMNFDILYKVYKYDEYVLYGFNKNPERTEPNAEDIVSRILKFEQEIFGTQYYLIKDNRLFDKWPDPSEKPTTFVMKEESDDDGDCMNHQVFEGGVLVYTYQTGNCWYGIPPGGIGAGPMDGGIGWVPIPTSGGGGGDPEPPAPLPPCDFSGWEKLTVLDGKLNGPCIEPLPIPPPPLPIGEWGDNIIGDYPELENQTDWVNSIDETGLASYPCLKGILGALKTSTTFYNTMEGFLGTKPTGHIKFGTTTDQVAGTTPNWANHFSTIRFNVDFLSHSTKSFAIQTFIHEMIHANIQRILFRMNDPAPTDIYKDVIKHFNEVKYNEMNEHDFMANIFIPYMKSVMIEIDNYFNLGPHNIPGTTTPDPNYYDAMAWSGLQEVEPGDGTAAWYELPATTRSAYEVILSREGYQGAGCN